MPERFIRYQRKRAVPDKSQTPIQDSLRARPLAVPVAKRSGINSELWHTAVKSLGVLTKVSERAFDEQRLDLVRYIGRTQITVGADNGSDETSDVRGGHRGTGDAIGMLRDDHARTYTRSSPQIFKLFIVMPPIKVEMTFTPGTKMSTTEPKLEKDARASAIVVAPSVITEEARAGE